MTSGNGIADEGSRILTQMQHLFRQTVEVAVTSILQQVARGAEDVYLGCPLQSGGGDCSQVLLSRLFVRLVIAKVGGEVQLGQVIAQADAALPVIETQYNVGRRGAGGKLRVLDRLGVCLKEWWGIPGREIATRGSAGWCL